MSEKALTVEEILAANKANAQGGGTEEPAGGGTEEPAGGGTEEPAGGGTEEPAGGGQQPEFNLEKTFDDPIPDDDDPIIERVTKDEKLRAKIIGIIGTGGPSVIADPDLARLDYLKKNDPDAYNLHTKNLFSGIQDMDLMVRDFIKENPEYAGKEDEAEEFLKAKYGLDIEIPSALDPEDDSITQKEIDDNKKAIDKAQKTLKINSQNFKMDANKRREALKQSFLGIKLPEPTAPEVPYAERKAQFITSWNEPFSGIAKEMVKIPISLKPTGSETSVPLMDYIVPAKDYVKFTKEAVNFAFDNKLDPTPENQEAVRAFIKSRIILEKGDEMFHAAVERARSMTDEQWEKEVHNPSGIDRSRSSGGDNASNDKYKEFLGKVSKM